MNRRIGLCAVVMCLVYGLPLWAQAPAAPNWLGNAQFAEWADGKALRWVHATQQPWKLETLKEGPAATAVRVDIENARGSSLGEIRQSVKVRPNTRYRASVDVKGTANGVGRLMIKLRKDRKEGQRIDITGSTTEWTTLSREFDTGDADEVQFLCRYSQRPEAVGQTVWFTNARLEALDGSAPLSDPGGAGPAQAGKPAFDPAAVIAAPAQDQYITPAGAGDRSGRDWANARPADQLQAAINAAGSGNTVFIGSGTYDNLSLILAAGGSGPSAPLTLAGHDTGEGLPVFVSTFDKINPARTGKTLLAINPGVSHVVIHDLKVHRHRQAVSLRGSNTNITLQNIDVTETRDAFWIDGGATGPEAGSRDIVLRDCDVTYFTKRAVRIFNGVSNVQITNCHADAGGRQWATEPFAVGFHIIGGKEGIKDRNITFTDCSASNAWHDGGDKYWNADGFAAERAVEDVTWIRCRAFNNTDGGWDVKSIRPKFVDCIGIANKRNFRIWLNGDEHPAELENCLSAFSHDYGGLNHHAGFWFLAGGVAVMKNCTAWGDPLALVVEGRKDPAQTALRVEHCLIRPADDGQAQRLAEGTDLQVDDSLILADGAAGPAPRAPSSTWRGGDDAFDLPDHPTLGYRHRPAER